MITFALAALALSTPTAPAAKVEAPRPTRYCAENVSDGTPYPRRVCKTRAEWLRDHGVDPLVVAETVRQRGR